MMGLRYQGKEYKKMFRSNRNSGFQITLPNGVTISTQFSYGHYCEISVYNPNTDNCVRSLKKPKNKITHSSIDAEVLLRYEKSGNQIFGFPYEQGGIAPYITIEEWLEIFDFARNLPEEKRETRCVR